MASLSLTVALCFLGVVSAVENLTIKERVCAQCKNAEDVYEGLLDTVLQQGKQTIDGISQWCSTFPEATKEQCTGLAEQWKKRYDETSVMILGTKPCEILLRCDPAAINMLSFGENPNLCEPCKQLVKALYVKLSIDKLVGQGRDVALQVCMMMGIADEDCKTAADEVVESLDVPSPEAACKQAGLCSITSDPY